MWNGKNKALTFSFDDGVMQDKKTIEILDDHGLKATFNLNSGHFGQDFPLEYDGKRIERKILIKNAVRETYKNHEIAVHTINHYNLTGLSEEEIIKEVNGDKAELEKLCGYQIVGMAYPCGGINNDDRVAEILRCNTDIKYARTITSTHNFSSQMDLLRFNPSVHIREEILFEIAEKFLKSESDTPQLLYVWGHSYEFDMIDGGWDRFKRLCDLLSAKKDVFYGTNKED